MLGPVPHWRNVSGEVLPQEEAIMAVSVDFSEIALERNLTSLVGKECLRPGVKGGIAIVSFEINQGGGPGQAE